MAKYSEKASDAVGRALHKEKNGTLKSGRSGKTVTSREQAIAIGLSEARAKGAKVPSKKSSAKKTTAKKVTQKSSAKKKVPVKKTVAKSTTKNSSMM
ncbi:MAG: hypothetical protein JWO58_2628 [Chitinophagaceae bacterium]|nr:hypothetical protein [Chitinophagaceae bacterium]